MMATSTERRSVFIFTTVSSAEFFSPLERIFSEAWGPEREGKKNEGKRGPASHPPSVHLPPSLCFFSPSPPPPPPLLSERLGNADVIWLAMAPGHVSICLSSFLMTTRRLTFRWRGAKRTRGRSRSLPSEINPATLPSPPYLGKTLLWVGITAIHLNASAAAAATHCSGLQSEILECRASVKRSHVATSLFGRRGCHTPRVAIVCFSVVRLINHEYFMIACSLLDKIPSSWWRMLMMCRIISLNVARLN